MIRPVSGAPARGGQGGEIGSGRGYAARTPEGGAPLPCSSRHPGRPQADPGSWEGVARDFTQSRLCTLRASTGMTNGEGEEEEE
jgi:hypothetical protein